MKKIKLLTLLLLTCLGWQSVWADNAPVGTVLWGESFDHFEANTPSSAGTGTGTTIYGDATITYAQSVDNTKAYNDSLAGGTAPELLLAKSKGTWTISGIATGNAKEMKLSFISNKTTFSLSSSVNKYTITGSGTNWTLTLKDGESAPTTIDLTLTNTSSNNARLDNVQLVVTAVSEKEVVTLTSVTISGTPTKTSYEEGESFDFSGLKATATYSDNSTVDVTDDATWEVTPATLAETTTSVSVVATYNNISDTKSNIAITVSKPSQNPALIFDDGTGWTGTQGAQTCTDPSTTITIATTSGVYSSSQYRVYKGQNFIISSNKVNITKIVFVCTASGTAQYGPGCYTLTAGGGSYSYSSTTGTWTGSSKSITLKAESAQVRMTSITVYYEESDEMQTPTFNPTSTDFLNSLNVTLQSTEGVDIYYTLDGTEPTTASTKYTQPIVLTTTTTIKAIASNGTKTSKVVAETYTKKETITCAQANALAKDEVAFLGAFQVVYINGSYIYIKDNSGYTLLYKYNYGLKAGDQVAAGMEVKGNPYKGLPECVPATELSDLTITAGTAPEIETMTVAPTANDINRVVKFSEVKFKDNATWTTAGQQYAYFTLGSDEVTCYNTFKAALDFDATKTYDVYGAISCYNSNIQVAVYSLEEIPMTAAIGDKQYRTLVEAVAAAQNGETVKLLTDAEGPTCLIEKNIVLDLNGHTYNITNSTYGNTVEGFACINNGNATIKNGTFKMVVDRQIHCIEGYCDTLTLTDVTIDVTACDWHSCAVYAASCVVFDGNTSIYAGTDHNNIVDAFGNSSYQGTCIIRSTGIFDGGNIKLNGGKIEFYSGNFKNTTWMEDKYTDGDVAIYGGTFSAPVPQKYCAEGYRPATNADSTYTVELIPMIAAIGDTQYATLVEAVAAAQNGDTVKLLTDAEGEGIKIIAANAKNITIDFGGFTYTATTGVGSANTTTQACHFEKGCNIVLKNGTLTSNNPEVIKMMIQNYGDLTLNDFIVDGTHIGLEGKTRYVVSNNSGNVAFTGKTQINAAEGDFAFDACQFGSYDIPTITIADNNVTINGKIEATGGNINISAGKFSYPIDPAWCAVGFMPTEIEEGVYGVKEIPMVAAIGDTQYATLVEAVAAAQNGETVKLLTDAEGPTCEIGKAIIWDLNGHTYNITATTSSYGGNTGFICKNNVNVTVKNGTIKVDHGMTIYCFEVLCDTLTLTDVNIDVTVCEWNESMNLYHFGYGSLTSKGVVVMNGTTSVYTGSSNNMIVSVNEYTNNVEGICIINSTGTFDGGIGLTGGKVQILSGNFNNITWKEYSSYKEGDVAIFGGTFSDSIPQKYCAEGYRPVMNADSTYTVELIPMVAAIGDKQYATLVEAIAASQDGDTVKLLCDAEGPTCEITKAIVLDLNNYTYNITATTLPKNVRGFHCTANGNILVKNGNIKVVNDMQIICFDCDCDTLTVTDVTFDVSVCKWYGTAVRADNEHNSTCVILNGNTSVYTGTGYNRIATASAYNSMKGTCIFNSTGIFDGGNIELWGGAIEIYSGTFHNTIWEEHKYTDGDAAIYGGTFSAPVPQKYCAEGYVPATADEGRYSVVELQSIALNKKVTTLTISKKDTLSLDIQPANATPEVIWTSENDSIATIVDGVVTAKASGIVRIIATVGKMKDTCVVTVLKDITNTPATAYTVSEAVNLASDIIADLSKPVYVKGVVTGTPVIDLVNGDATFDITDGEKTMTMQNVLDLDSAKFAAIDKVADKDTVIMYGLISIQPINDMTILSNGYIYQLTKHQGTGTGMDELNADKQKAIKIIRDNQVIIIRNDKEYDINGAAL